MAAVTPQITPWATPPRGSSDGVNDRQAKTRAAHEPGRVNVSHAGRRLRPGPTRGSAGDAGPAGPAGAPASVIVERAPSISKLLDIASTFLTAPRAGGSRVGLVEDARRAARHTRDDQRDADPDGEVGEPDGEQEA